MPDIKKCPYCGAEMEAGFMQSSRAIIWDTEEAEGFILASAGGFQLTKGIFRKQSFPSSYCKNCGVFISPLPEHCKK